MCICFCGILRNMLCGTLSKLAKLYYAIQMIFKVFCERNKKKKKKKYKINNPTPNVTVYKSNSQCWFIFYNMFKADNQFTEVFVKL